MEQVYKVVRGFSEGFYSGMSEDEKTKKLRESGLTFVYSESYSRTVFFEPGVDTEQSRAIMRARDELLKESSVKELEEALERCFYAIGVRGQRREHMSQDHSYAVFKQGVKDDLRNLLAIRELTEEQYEAYVAENEDEIRSAYKRYLNPREGDNREDSIRFSTAMSTAAYVLDLCY